MAERANWGAGGRQRKKLSKAEQVIRLDIVEEKLHSSFLSLKKALPLVAANLRPFEKLH
jgi:hypothetical protein